MNEMWKSIKDYPDYEVSNMGRIRSLKRNTVRILKQQPSRKRGVMMVRLGRSKTASAHRLVATAFIPNPQNKPQVNHIDGNPGNNYVDNLEWVTASENIKHAFNTGLVTVESFSGENSGTAKLTNKQAEEIRLKYATTPKSGLKLSEEYGVHKTNIYRIINKTSYQNRIKTP